MAYCPYLRDKIYTAWPFYGSRRIHEQMAREGQIVNRKAVQRYIQEMGLVAVGPRPGQHLHGAPVA